MSSSGVCGIGLTGTGVLVALRSVMCRAGGVFDTLSSTVCAESSPESSNSGDFESVTFANVSSEIFNKSIHVEYSMSM